MDTRMIMTSVGLSWRAPTVEASVNGIRVTEKKYPSSMAPIITSMIMAVDLTASMHDRPSARAVRRRRSSASANAPDTPTAAASDGLNQPL